MNSIYWKTRSFQMCYRIHKEELFSQILKKNLYSWSKEKKFSSFLLSLSVRPPHHSILEILTFLAMAGLNIRLNKDGTRLFFQNRNGYIANVNLAHGGFEVERVYSIKELKELVKFEAESVGSDIVAMAQDGTLKLSSKNNCYKLSTDSKSESNFFLY